MTKFPSVCTFFVALLFFSFQGTTTSIRVSVGVTAGIVSVLIFWCIVNSWDSGERDSEDYELIDELDDEEHLHVHEQNTT
jgi:di/tricarboxylate transporter